jgi:peptide deformylase
MINPNFRATNEHCEKDWEGCLSIPGIRALVPRYTEIQVDYQDINGLRLHVYLSGFIARVFQHEFDHLLGHVYLDRVESNLDIVSEKMFQELYV